MGAELPEKLLKQENNQADIEAYLKLLLSTKFSQQFIDMLFSIKTTKGNKFAEKALTCFPVNIKQATKSTGSAHNMHIFLTGDESVNAHYLTGSGVLAGWDSNMYLAELLSEGLPIEEIKQKYQVKQELIKQTLVAKSEKIKLLKAKSSYSLRLEKLLSLFNKAKDKRSFLDSLSDIERAA